MKKILLIIIALFLQGTCALYSQYIEPYSLSCTESRDNGTTIDITGNNYDYDHVSEGFMVMGKDGKIYDFYRLDPGSTATHFGGSHTGNYGRIAVRTSSDNGKTWQFEKPTAPFNPNSYTDNTLVWFGDNGSPYDPSNPNGHLPLDTRNQSGGISDDGNKIVLFFRTFNSTMPFGSGVDKQCYYMVGDYSTSGYTWSAPKLLDEEVVSTSQIVKIFDSPNKYMQGFYSYGAAAPTIPKSYDNPNGYGNEVRITNDISKWNYSTNTIYQGTNEASSILIPNPTVASFPNSPRYLNEESYTSIKNNDNTYNVIGLFRGYNDPGNQTNTDYRYYQVTFKYDGTSIQNMKLTQTDICTEYNAQGNPTNKDWCVSPLIHYDVSLNKIIVLAPDRRPVVTDQHLNIYINDTSSDIIAPTGLTVNYNKPYASLLRPNTILSNIQFPNIYNNNTTLTENFFGYPALVKQSDGNFLATFCENWADPCDTYHTDAARMYQFHIIYNLNDNYDKTNVTAPGYINLSSPEYPYCTITGNSTVTAGKYIRINPGFHACSGSTFHASISTSLQGSTITPSSNITPSFDCSYEPPLGKKDLQSKIVQKDIPTEYSISQSYPNPCNPTSRIVYSLPNASQVTVKVYNALGKEVKELVNQYQEAGYYNVTFDGSSLASGIYIYRIQAGNFITSKKIILMK